MLLDRYQDTEFFTIVIIYRVNTLNEQMEQNRKYVLVAYAVTHQDICNISEFSSVSWVQDMMLIESIAFHPFFIYYKSHYLRLLKFIFHLFVLAFISCSYFSCNDRIFISSAALISSKAEGDNG